MRPSSDDSRRVLGRPASRRGNLGRVRTLTAAAGACVVLLAAGCSSSVAGRAEVASGAVVPNTSASAPSRLPEPSSGQSGTTPGNTSSAAETPQPSRTGRSDSESPRSSGTTGSSPQPDDTSVSPTPVTSIPGLSTDCNAVLAGITAFSTLLQTAAGGDPISQAAVDQALSRLPRSGLPARPQADITVLRTTISGAAGKSLADLSQLLADGQVVDALKDLSSWAESNCG